LNITRINEIYINLPVNTSLVVSSKSNSTTDSSELKWPLTDAWLNKGKISFWTSFSSISHFDPPPVPPMCLLIAAALDFVMFLVSCHV